MNPFNWDCPHCNRAQTVTMNAAHVAAHFIDVRNTKWGTVGLQSIAIGCSNPDCKEMTLVANVVPYKRDPSHNMVKDETLSPLLTERLYPASAAKPQPEFIPPGLREDYVEACRIRDLSPKASATLARRCLQGMIRDFTQIKKATLFAEIEALKQAVDDAQAPAGVTAESVEAIDQVRGIGNIGAHMEKDIDLIIPVDPEEAQLLIGLIEDLFDEWYVARQKRGERLAAIKKTADDKKALIAAGRAAPALAAPAK